MYSFLQSSITWGLYAFFALGLYGVIEIYFFPLFLRPSPSHDDPDQTNLHHSENSSEGHYGSGETERDRHLGS